MTRNTFPVGPVAKQIAMGLYYANSSGVTLNHWHLYFLSSIDSAYSSLIFNV